MTFQWTEDQRKRTTAVREVTDKLTDAVSRKRAHSSVIGAIAEVRIQRRQGRDANGEPPLVHPSTEVSMLTLLIPLC